MWKRHRRYAADGTWDRVLTQVLAEADAAEMTPPARTRTQGAGSNHKVLPLTEVEPPGHGIGRSRGGLTTKIHQVVDGRVRPLAAVVTGGQRNDGTVLAQDRHQRAASAAETS